MEKTKVLWKKILTIIVIIVMIVNIVLLVDGKINPFLFWSILAVCAIIAFTIFPRKK